MASSIIVSRLKAFNSSVQLTQQENDIQPTHLSDYLTFNAATTPAKLALVFDDKSMTWQQLAQEVNEFARKLDSVIRPYKSSQAVVGILIPNCWEYVVAYLAVIRLGHIAMPIDTSYKQLEIDAIIDQTKPNLIISLDEHPGSSFYSFKTICKLDSDDDPIQIRLSPDKQIASLLFTSGTTGLPKAVPNTHANHIWNIKTCSEVWRWTSDETILISLRLSHMYGLIMGLSGSLYHGNTLYLQDWFDAKATLEMLSSGKITMFKHVPFAYQAMLSYASDHPDEKYDISKVRIMISGGGPLPPDDWERFRKHFGVKIVETYGSSETGRIAGNHLDNPQPGSPGPLLPGVKAKLSPESELLIKSDGVFPGYYKNSAATKSGFTSDGWWRTGDMVEIKNGRIILRGRVHERIRKFGYTISPRDVEWALIKHPQIKEVYVMGVPDNKNLSDTLVYFIVGNISDEELRQYSKDNLLFAWRADKVIRLEKLPRTPTGKPKIPALRKLLEIE